MARAASSTLDTLHGLAAAALTEELRRASASAAAPRTILVDVDGKPTEQPNPAYAPLNPQLIDKVLKFLKDNGIDSPAKSVAVSSLAQALGDIDLDEVGASLPN